MALPPYVLPEGVEKIFNAAASDERAYLADIALHMDIDWRTRAEDLLRNDDEMAMEESSPLLGFLVEGDRLMEPREVDSLLSKIESPQALACADEIFKAQIFRARLERIALLDKRERDYEDARRYAIAETASLTGGRERRIPQLPENPLDRCMKRLKTEYDPKFFAQFNGEHLEYVQALRDAHAEVKRRKAAAAAPA